MSRRSRLPLLVLVMVLAVVAAGAGYVVLHDRDGAAGTPPAGAPQPVASPARDVPEPSRAPLLTSATDAPAPTSAGLTAVVASALRDPRLGGRLAGAVVDARTGETLYDNRGSAPVTPASTTKIATATAALAVLDPEARLTTRVVAGATPGQVVVIGGGDPTLVGSRSYDSYPRRASITDLAAQVRRALGAQPVTSVVVDATLYSGPALGPGWKTSYVTGGDVAPVAALLVDAGRVSANGPRSQAPALSAGSRIARALGAPGVPVALGAAPEGGAELGAVRSPTFSQLVELMLTRSDNDIAEALARQVALVKGQPASFDGGSAAVDAVLSDVLPDVAPEDFALRDGSGLSRVNRLEPLALSRLLSHVATDETGTLRTVLTGLPVAGFDGTLARRFRDGASAVAAGAVRGKTGTLNGVSALAGVLRTRDGRLLAFDLTADAVPPGANRAAEVGLDALAAAIASCGCR